MWRRWLFFSGVNKHREKCEWSVSRVHANCHRRNLLRCVRIRRVSRYFRVNEKFGWKSAAARFGCRYDIYMKVALYKWYEKKCEKIIEFSPYKRRAKIHFCRAAMRYDATRSNFNLICWRPLSPEIHSLFVRTSYSIQAWQLETERNTPIVKLGCTTNSIWLSRRAGPSNEIIVNQSSIKVSILMDTRSMAQRLSLHFISAQKGNGSLIQLKIYPLFILVRMQ